MLIARSEFSIVIVALGVSVADAPDLKALAAGYVLITAIAGPLLTRYADRIPLPRRLTDTTPPEANTAPIER